MKDIGRSIAFASLVAAAAYLEVHDKSATGLWVIVVLWVFFGGWHPAKKGAE